MKKVCMVAYTYYPADPRLRREAEELADAGWQVDVVCLRDAGQPAEEHCGGADTHRVPLGRHRGHGAVAYLAAYMAFFVLALYRVSALYVQKRHQVIHVQNLPDFLVFTAILPRLFGARVVLDLRDLVPELYMAKYHGDSRHPMVRSMCQVERVSTAFSHHVITASDQFSRCLVNRQVPADKLTVILNGADPRLFAPRSGAGTRQVIGDTFTLMYHGTLAERYGLDIAIRAVHRLQHAIPGLRFDVYGAGEEEDNLKRLTRDLGLQERVRLHGPAPIDAIPDLIAAADLGVVPMRKNVFTDLAHSTKAFEYITLGIPVVLSRTRAMEEVFGDVPDMFFDSEDIEGLATRILFLYRNPARMAGLVDAAQKVYTPFTWEVRRHEYLSLMGRLAGHESVAGVEVGV